jgi:hypothetical protein
VIYKKGSVLWLLIIIYRRIVIYYTDKGPSFAASVLGGLIERDYDLIMVQRRYEI